TEPAVCGLAHWVMTRATGRSAAVSAGAAEALAAIVRSGVRSGPYPTTQASVSASALSSACGLLGTWPAVAISRPEPRPASDSSRSRREQARSTAGYLLTVQHFGNRLQHRVCQVVVFG